MSDQHQLAAFCGNLKRRSRLTDEEVHHYAILRQSTISMCLQHEHLYADDYWARMIRSFAKDVFSSHPEWSWEDDAKFLRDEIGRYAKRQIEKGRQLPPGLVGLRNDLCQYFSVWKPMREKHAA